MNSLLTEIVNSMKTEEHILIHKRERRKQNKDKEHILIHKRERRKQKKEQ